MIRRTKLFSQNLLFMMIAISLLTSFSLVVISFIPSKMFMEIEKIKILKKKEYSFNSEINFKKEGFYYIGINIQNGKPLIGCARLFLRVVDIPERIKYDFAKYFPDKCLDLIDKDHRNLKLVVSITKNVFGLQKTILKSVDFYRDRR